jgi:hypothetical protein
MSEILASEASLFLDFAAFHAADLSLSDKEPIVKDIFGSLCRVEPDAERCKFP